jgi:hypothetical protein
MNLTRLPETACLNKPISSGWPGLIQSRMLFSLDCEIAGYLDTLFQGSKMFMGGILANWLNAQDGAASIATPWQDLKKVKGAPWWVLISGLVLVALTPVAKLFVSPSGDAAFIGHLFYWVLSLSAFLLPMAFFTVINLKRQIQLGYPTNRATLSRVRIAFLALGLTGSLFQAYQLATELSKLLNVG